MLGLQGRPAMLFVIIAYPQTMGTTVGPVTVKHTSVVSLTHESVNSSWGLKISNNPSHT